VVENAFGILANRLQLLQKDINLSVAKVQNITLTCCVLHNFIKRRDGKRYLYGMDHENTTAGTTAQGSWREEVFITGLERCKVNRNAEEPIALRTTFFNEIGVVPWQREAIKKFNF
jgi:hypothetical protein